VTVKIGVIGAGALGYHHTRILRDVPGAELIGFHDANAERAAKVSSELGVKSFDSLEAMLDQVKAVSVVVPSPSWRTISYINGTRNRARSSIRSNSCFDFF